MRKKTLFFLTLVFILFVLFIMHATEAVAEWRIEYSDQLIQEMRKQGRSVSKYFGHYCTKQECQKALNAASVQGFNVYGNEARCVGSNCPGGRSGSSTPFGGVGGYRSSEDFAMQMFGSLFGSLLQAALAPPKVDHAYQQQLALKKKQEALKQAAIKKQAVVAHRKFLAQEAARKAEEEARNRQRGVELLAMMGSIDGGSPDLYAGMNRVGGGKLGLFGSVTPKLEATPMGAGIYDTSALTSWQRLLCSAYFSTKALEASRGGDPEGARHMNTQADRVAAGEMTDVECRMPGLQQLADIQPQNLQQNNRMTEMVKLLPMVQEKVERLQQIELKLHGAKEEKQEAQIKLEEAENKIEEARVQAESAQTPEEKSEADYLLAQAFAFQNEASGEVEKAEQAEREYAEVIEKQREELRDIKEKMNTGSATK